MCLAISGPPGAVTIDLICEQIWLDVAKGVLTACEIYDVFFVPKCDGSLCLVAHSPHVLFAEDELFIGPGLNTQEQDVQYNAYYAKLGPVTYDPNESFAVNMDSGEAGPSEPCQFTGKIVTPQCKLPSEIRNEVEAVALIGELGTPAELHLPTLQAGITYVMRLRVSPRTLLLEPPLNIPDPITDEDGPWWEQTVQLLGPDVVAYNLRCLVRKASSFAAGERGASAWSRLLWRCLDVYPAGRHRLSLILPRHASLLRDHAVGLMQLPATALAYPPDRAPRAVYQWEGGAGAHQPRGMAEAVFRYVHDWGGGDGKTKEQITAALSLPHPNCALIVSALEKHKALREVRPDSGRYSANVNRDQAQAILDTVARDTHVIQHFEAIGFAIDYTIRFFNPSPALLAELQQTHRHQVDLPRQVADLALSIDQLRMELKRRSTQ